ncbi:PilT/PilU family type 4a pilus ATPase [Lyngbya aestuarii]|uniref:PilT/PilU family type 4a pilus ATPase n=1 Tax=Lyngbya aestuarii TaxID=118322 RepID=UPI00403DC1F2
MLKITQAPTRPIPVLRKFSIAGIASSDHTNKNLTLSVDSQLKMTGPIVDQKGAWRIDFLFQQAGHHHLNIAVDDESVNLRVQVIGGKVQPGTSPVPPPPPKASSPSSELSTSTLEELVKEAYEKGASDLHIGVGKVPSFRNRGLMEATKYPITDEATFYSWLQEVLKPEDIRRFQETMDFDGAAQYKFSRVRINVFNTVRGPAMVMRLIPLKIMTIDELNLPLVLKDICHHQKGLILITGPTGSGKSTTLAAMIDYLNGMPKHIITIEDPIEFVHDNRQALIDQREVGMHTLEFEKALRASLREDPDIILVGEMRDRETVNTAIKAAQTGHLVFATLHTNSAVKTMERILTLYNPDEQNALRFQIAETFVAVVAQSLVVTTDGKRTAVQEIMINTDTIKDLIKRGELAEIEALIPECTIDGMCTMNQALYRLYEEGQITEETALNTSPNSNEMIRMLKGVLR